MSLGESMEAFTDEAHNKLLLMRQGINPALSTALSESRVLRPMARTVHNSNKLASRYRAQMSAFVVMRASHPINNNPVVDRQRCPNCVRLRRRQRQLDCVDECIVNCFARVT